jgi:hypothetical protein
MLQIYPLIQSNSTNELPIGHRSPGWRKMTLGRAEVLATPYETKHLLPKYGLNF